MRGLTITNVKFINRLHRDANFRFHGGSFYAGSATDPGLDGSKLAKQMNGIVVFVQYRLGVLGFLPPTNASTASGNLGVKDAIVALKFAKQTLTYFGSNSKITIGGQSSGGHMVRSLLASPEAVNYFQGATLHGDPVQWRSSRPASTNPSKPASTPPSAAAADRAATANNSPYYNPMGSNLIQPYVQNGDVARQAFDRSVQMNLMLGTAPRRPWQGLS